MKALKNSLMAIVAIFALVITVAAQAGSLDNTSLKVAGPGCYVIQPTVGCNTTYPTLPPGQHELILSQTVCVQNPPVSQNPINPDLCVGDEQICCYNVIAAPNCCTGFRVDRVFFEDL